MRIAYSTNRSNKNLLEIFSEEFKDLKSNVLEFTDGEYGFITIKNRVGKLFCAVIKDSTIYVEEEGSGIGELLEKKGIIFSTAYHNRVPNDLRIEKYFSTYSFNGA